MRLDLKQQYLCFYLTDFAQILHANRKKGYVSSLRILKGSVSLFGVSATSKCFFWEKTRFLMGYTKKSDVYPIQSCSAQKTDPVCKFSGFAPNSPSPFL